MAACGNAQISGNPFKIPADKCQCPSRKIIKFGTKSLEDDALEVFFNHNAHLNAFTILKLTTKVADFKVIHSLLSEMTTIDNNKSMPDPKFLPLAKGFIETFLRVHPPCEHHTFDEYRKVLEEGDRFSKLFKEMANKIELVSKNVLPDNCSRQRKAPKKHSDEYSADYMVYVKAMQAIEDRVTKKFSDLPPAEILSHLFSAFSILVGIVEKDLAIWRETQSSGLTSSKSYRPLIVHLLWKDVLRFDRDAILNKRCLDIFKFYQNCLHNNVSPVHLKAVARLINIIAEVVELIGRHQEAKPEDGLNLNKDFRNFVYQARVDSGFHGFALKQIENGRRKLEKPILYHLDERTAIGTLCKEFAKSFAASVGRCTCEDVKECLVLEKALIFIKPPWLLHLTTCCLLKQDSDVSSLRSTARGALSDEEDLTTQKHRLRSILFSSAVDTFQMLGFRTSGPRRDPKRASKRIKVEQGAVNNANDVEEIVSLIKTHRIKTS